MSRPLLFPSRFLYSKSWVKLDKAIKATNELIWVYLQHWMTSRSRHVHFPTPRHHRLPRTPPHMHHISRSRGPGLLLPTNHRRRRHPLSSWLPQTCSRVKYGYLLRRETSDKTYILWAPTHIGVWNQNKVFLFLGTDSRVPNETGGVLYKGFK